MKFQELIKKRQSVRRYQDKPVGKEKLDILIESVRLAPSASNSQPWTLIVVDDPKLKTEVAKTTFSKALAFNQFAIEAPVFAVLVIEKPRVITQIGGNLKRREFPLIDIGIAASQFCLQATELGLSTCMIGWFNEKKLKQILHIPKQKRIGLVISLGYEPEDYKQREKIRKQKEEMSRFNQY